MRDAVRRSVDGVKNTREPASRLSRRSLLAEAASALAVLGASACSKAPDSCNDPNRIKPEQRAIRDALGYTEPTTEPGKTCAKCGQYQAPEKMSDCGGCKVLPGPVHPNGYCRAFVPKA